MKAARRCRKILPFFQGLALIAIGASLVILQPQEGVIEEMAAQQAMLVEGHSLYEKVFLELKDIYFRVYLFDVQNPDEVMEGAAPILKERGPYVYEMSIKKKIISVDEDLDEISFAVTKTYIFNKQLSGGTENDEITFINSAYMGSIITMAKQFPSFVKKIGNDIEKLFPDMEDVFVRAKVSDILFKGLVMACDPVAYPELKLICGFLMGKKPPGIRNTETPGIYKWSFFERLNATEQAAMTVNRGVRTKSQLGNLTSFNGKRKQRIWGSDYCNLVQGSDAITWPTMPKRLDKVFSFEPQLCRWQIARFEKDVIINSVIGRRYVVDERSWDLEDNECYCPLVARKPQCLVKGIIDITACQETPVFYSEPHFLYGDPSLREYAKGLAPDIEKHGSSITIEPLSGAPLKGSKKLQLNIKLMKMPAVTMLANVSDGYFPILWCEEAADSTVSLIADILQAYRLRRLLGYLTYVPLALGIFLVIKAVFLHGDPEAHFEILGFVPAHSILIRNPPTNPSTRRPLTRRPRRVNNGFE